MKTTLSLLCGTALSVLSTAAFAADNDLIVFDYSGFENPDFHQAYVAQHGDSPAFTFFGDEEEAFQKIANGFKTDVTHICAGSVTKWVESGLIEAWDTSKIAAYGDLNSDLKGEDVAAGAAYFIPTDYGTTAVAYNPEAVADADLASLQAFLDPKYAGRVTIPDNVDDAYALAYLATGTTNWQNATDEQFEAASAWLRELHPNLRTYWTDPAELGQLLASQEAVISWAWNEVYPAMVDEGRPAGFKRDTTEGTSVWLCGYVNMKDAPGSEDKAYDYLNAMLAPESARPLLDEGFGHANAAAYSQFSTEELVASGLGDVSVPVLAQLPISIELREKHSETFEKIKAGF